MSHKKHISAICFLSRGIQNASVLPPVPGATPSRFGELRVSAQSPSLSPYGRRHRKACADVKQKPPERAAESCEPESDTDRRCDEPYPYVDKARRRRSRAHNAPERADLRCSHFSHARVHACVRANEMPCRSRASHQVQLNISLKPLPNLSTGALLAGMTMASFLMGLKPVLSAFCFSS